MPETKTNNVTVQYARESSLGVTPTSGWKLTEPNAIPNFGANIEKVARNPISKNRQRRKGAIVGLESTVGLEMDLTMEHVIDFIEGFQFSIFKGGRVVYPAGASAVTTTLYTVPAMADALAQNTLVYARGFAFATNNGLKVVDAGGTTTEIPITGGGMTAEVTTATQNATVEVCGVQGASGDIQLNASGHIVSTVLDFTTLGLTVGQWMFVGGTVAATNFATLISQSTVNRWVRITSIAANLITTDQRGATYGTDNGAGKTIHLYFGRFVRNVAVDSADFLTRSHTFEVAYDDLGAGPVDMYHYAQGNLCNEWTLELQLGELAKMQVGFIGTDTPVPTTVRATGANAGLVPVQTAAFSPVGDIARLRLDEANDTGITTDFRSLSLKINNNVLAEYKLAQLAAAYMSQGNFEIDIDAEMFFTNDRVVAAVRDNSTLSMDVAMRNGDGGFVLDIPEMTASEGTPQFPLNELVKVQTTLMAHQSATFGFSLGVSIFPFVPAT